MTLDLFRTLAIEFLSAPISDPEGRVKPIPKHVLFTEAEDQAWVFRLWRPFLAIRVTRNPRTGVLRFAPAFYNEITTLPSAAIDKAILHAAKEAAVQMGEMQPHHTFNGEIVIAPENPAPPRLVTAMDGAAPVVLMIDDAERVVGELDPKRADTPHPFWRISQLTTQGAVAPNESQRRILKRYWRKAGIPALLLFAFLLRVPPSWAAAVALEL